jgi:hypothetical protein
MFWCRLLRVGVDALFASVGFSHMVSDFEPCADKVDISVIDSGIEFLGEFSSGWFVVASISIGSFRRASQRLLTMLNASRFDFRAFTMTSDCLNLLLSGYNLSKKSWSFSKLPHAYMGL